MNTNLHKLGLSAVFSLGIATAMAQTTINPSQPGAADPIPSAQTSGLVRPLTPVQPGADLGSELANEVAVPMQPSTDTITDTELGLEGAATPGAVYDDNIFISDTNRVADIIWAVTAGAAFELGDYRNLQENFLIAEWYGTGYFYTNNPAQDAFNQSAALLGQYRWEKLKAQLSSRYQYLTGPDRQVGSFATRHIFNNAILLNYDYSDKTVFDAEFAQETQLFQSYFNQYDYRGKAGAEYQILPKTWVGLEGVVGALNVDGSPLQYYQQARIRMKYSYTGKLNFKLSAGVETREVEGVSGVRVNGVFSLGLEYRPFDGTLISLQGYRNVIGSNSLQGQDYIATGFSISIQQRFLQRIYTGLTFGYENDVYFAVAPGAEADRIDNYIFLRPSISYAMNSWLTAGVFYEYRNNASTQDNSAFYNNRFGVELGAQF
jgi:Putative beta-barrel porin 2